jgi:hypothetical protein
VDKLPVEVMPLSWLIGSWVGVGLGTYPTIEDFRFGQEVVFSCDGRPFINYVSRSWLLDEEGERIKPLAIESGYWRPQPDNNIELLLAHPNGVAEIYVGTTEVLGLDDAKITSARAVLKTDVVTRTESAKPYTQGERLYGLFDSQLVWTFDMAAMGQPMQNHLSAKLRPAVEDL